MRISTIVLTILSPTRAIIAWLKDRPSGDKHAILRKWNLGWFWAELIALAGLAAASHFCSLRPTMAGATYAVYMAIWLFPFSRCNEIAYAFYHDAFDKSQKVTRFQEMSAAERIQMLIRSYLGLTMNFAIIYFFLPSCMYDPELKTPVQALYFSGITIATLGYGDFKPIHGISQLLAVYEVFSGLLLLVVALAVYVSNLYAGKTAEHVVPVDPETPRAN